MLPRLQKLLEKCLDSVELDLVQADYACASERSAESSTAEAHVRHCSCGIQRTISRGIAGNMLNLTQATGLQKLTQAARACIFGFSSFWWRELLGVKFHRCCAGAAPGGAAEGGEQGA